MARLTAARCIGCNTRSGFSTARVRDRLIFLKVLEHLKHIKPPVYLIIGNSILALGKHGVNQGGQVVYHQVWLHSVMWFVHPWPVKTCH